jgi:hypothetical protein
MKLKVASVRRPVVFLSDNVADMLSPSLWSSRQSNGSTMDGYRRVQGLENLGDSSPEAGTLYGPKGQKNRAAKMQRGSFGTSVCCRRNCSLLINLDLGQPAIENPGSTAPAPVAPEMPSASTSCRHAASSGRAGGADDGRTVAFAIRPWNHLVKLVWQRPGSADRRFSARRRLPGECRTVVVLPHSSPWRQARRTSLASQPSMDIVLLLFLVLLNGVLAMSEIAVVSSRQSRLRTLADDGLPGARSALA